MTQFLKWTTLSFQYYLYILPHPQIDDDQLLPKGVIEIQRVSFGVYQ